MAIRLICVCGRTLSIPDNCPNQRFKCPHCQARLHIPNPTEDRGLVRWYCSCGQRLKASSRAGGRRVNCPQCGCTTMVPAFSASDDVDSAMALPDDEADPVAPTILTAVETPSNEPPAVDALPLDEGEDVYDLTVPQPPPPNPTETVIEEDDGNNESSLRPPGET